MTRSFPCAPLFGIVGLVAVVGCEAPTSSSVDASVDGAARRQPPNGGLERYPLEVRFPEGGTYDEQSGSFYVGSLADGSVSRVDRETGREEVMFRETLPGTWWTLGMDVDAARRRLWVCAMDDQRGTTSESPPYEGHVWVFDLDTGERVARHALGEAFPRATCTDVAVASDGSAYVTDRESPNVYRLTEAGPPELFVTDDLLGATIVGQNAAVVLPDQSALLVLLYLPSRLVRVDLGDRGVRDVEIDGSFIARSPALSGADGMTLSGEALLVAFTSKVARLTPTSADWSSARAISVDVPPGITDVIHAEGADYLLNGQAVQFAFGQETEPFELVFFAGFQD